jgi:DNA-binding transcriptional MerR regulator
MTRASNKNLERLNLTELAAKTGCPGRTIRFYIARGLLPGPGKAGRGASYGPDHVRRISEIRALQANGLTLTEVARRLAGEADAPALPAPASWWSYELQKDVVVQVRADASPWRLRQIQRAMKDMAARLAEPNAKEDEHGNR